MNDPDSERELRYRPEIDGLRAVSVIAVIVNHFQKDLLPNGHLGVDAFFVISGYVITGSLISSPHARVTDFLIGFYTRRIRRLVPALAVCVLVTSILVCLFNPEPGVSLLTGIASLFGFSNLYLLKLSADYFAPNTELNVFSHTWSLGVEEQFYLVFPLILWLLTNGGKGSGSTKKRILFTIGALSGASLSAFIHLGGTDQLAAFYLMPARFWELGAGCLVFVASGQKVAGGRVAGLGALAALGALTLALAAPFRFTVLATFAVVASMGILLATTRPKTHCQRILSLPQLVYVGTISYGLYLWHWSVLSISRWTIGVEWWSWPFQFALMLLLAAGSTRWLEAPLRRATWSRHRLGTIGYGLGSSLAVAVLLAVLWKPMNGGLFLGKDATIDATIKIGAIPAAEPDGGVEARKLVTDCNLTSRYLSGKRDGSGPSVDFGFVEDCLKRGGSRRKVLLVGDSFAQMSAGHLAALARRLGFDFGTVLGYRCPYPLRPWEIRSALAAACGQADEDLVRKAILDSLGDGDLLAVRLYLEKNEYLDYGDGGAPPINAYDEAFLRLAREVRAKGASLIVLGSNPTLSTWHLRALTPPQWFNLKADRVTVRPLDNKQTSYYHLLDDHLRRRLDGMSGIRFFSLKPYLCDERNSCLVADGEKVLYFDNYHLTGYGFDLMYEGLLRAVEATMGIAGSTLETQPQTGT